MLRHATQRRLPGQRLIPGAGHYVPPPLRRAAQTRLALEAVVLLGSILATWVLASRFIDPRWSLVSLFNYAWLCLLMFRIEPRITLLLAPFILSRASTVVALVFIEYRGEIPELGMVGEPGPYSASFLFYSLLFLGSALLAFTLLVPRGKEPRPTAMSMLYDRYANFIGWTILAVGAAMVVAFILNGLTAGFPLLAGIDRFEYRRFSANIFVLYGLNFKYVLQFALGFIAFRSAVSPLLRRSAIGMAVLLFFMYFLFGDKFFTQLAAVIAFVTPYLYYNFDVVMKRLPLFVGSAVALFALVFGVTWYIYSNNGRLSTSATAERMSGRMVGQGELWFIQNRIGAPAFNWEGGMIAKNIEALSIKEVEPFALVNSLASAHYSNRYTPDWLRASLRKNGGYVTFTAALDPIGMHMFGKVGLAFFLILCGGLVALASSYLAWAIMTRSPVSAVFASYIFMQLDNTLSQATPWVLFSIFVLKWVALIAVIELGLHIFVSLPQRGLGLSRRMARKLPGTGGRNWPRPVRDQRRRAG